MYIGSTVFMLPKVILLKEDIPWSMFTKLIIISFTIYFHVFLMVFPSDLALKSWIFLVEIKEVSTCSVNRFTILQSKSLTSTCNIISGFYFWKQLSLRLEVLHNIFTEIEIVWFLDLKILSSFRLFFHSRHSLIFYLYPSSRDCFPAKPWALRQLHTLDIAFPLDDFQQYSLWSN